MTDTAMVPRKSEGREPARPALIDEHLADQLLGKAQAEGVELLGPDGLLSQVTKAVLERAPDGEMTAHLGYEKHDPARGTHRIVSAARADWSPPTPSARSGHAAGIVQPLPRS